MRCYLKEVGNVQLPLKDADRASIDLLRIILPPIKLGEYTSCPSARSAEWKLSRFTHALNAKQSSAKSVATRRSRYATTARAGSRRVLARAGKRKTGTDPMKGINLIRSKS